MASPVVALPAEATVPDRLALRRAALWALLASRLIALWASAGTSSGTS